MSSGALDERLAPEQGVAVLARPLIERATLNEARRSS